MYIAIGANKMTIINNIRVSDVVDYRTKTEVYINESATTFTRVLESGIKTITMNRTDVTLAEATKISQIDDKMFVMLCDSKEGE